MARRCRTGVKQYGHDRASARLPARRRDPARRGVRDESRRQGGEPGGGGAVRGGRCRADHRRGRRHTRSRGPRSTRRKGSTSAMRGSIPGVQSGVALIFVGEGGKHDRSRPRGQCSTSLRRTSTRLPERLFTPGAILLASLEVPFATVVRGLEAAPGGRHDDGARPAPIDPAILDPEVLALVDVLTPNHEEVRALVLDASPTEPGDVVATALEAVRLLRELGGPQRCRHPGPRGLPRRHGCGLCPGPRTRGRGGRYSGGRRRFQRGLGGGPGRGAAAGRCRGLGLRRGGAGRHPARGPGRLAPPG